MISNPDDTWLAACAHRLQQHWRTVDPIELEAVAAEIWHDPRLRTLPPDEAAALWLRPVEVAAMPQSFAADNGMLARVPGERISDGAKLLPPPTAGAPASMRAEIDVAGIGRVRISYRLASARHRGEGRHWFWNACHAEPSGSLAR